MNKEQNQNNKYKYTTIIVLGIICITELLITKESSAFMLFVFYGIYKLIKDE